MTTPFIDVLSPEAQAKVAKGRKDPRPSYFSADIARSQPGEEDAGQIMISEDLEAVLILMPAGVRQGVIDFIQASLEVASKVNQDDFALMSEVLAVRETNYQQINTDVGHVVQDYDQVKSNLTQFIESRAREAADDRAVDIANITSVLIPDLGSLFADLSEAHVTLSRPDELALHDRVTDAGFVYDLQSAANFRSEELLSWQRVFQTYVV